jgi:hypothetical protein
MAKNDYFVIMYRILAYLYACMKQGEKPDMSTVSFEALGIPESYYNYVMINMIEKQYIKGAAPFKVLGGIEQVKFIDPHITQEGVEFLTENSKMKKTGEFLKSVLEFVPGLSELIP